MGLFDEVAGAVMGKMTGNNNGSMAQIAMEMLNQNGGLSGVLAKLNSNGLAAEAASWVSQGENLPVSPDQVVNALGSTTISDLALKFGLTPEMLSAQIAEHLPKLVDKMTPNGEVNADSNNLLSTVLGMLK